MVELEALAAERYVSPSLVAQIHVGLGDGPTALAWLQKALALRAVDLAWLATRPIFDSLRDAPEMARLLLEIYGSYSY